MQAVMYTQESLTNQLISVLYVGNDIPIYMLSIWCHSLNWDDFSKPQHRSLFLEKMRGVFNRETSPASVSYTFVFLWSHVVVWHAIKTKQKNEQIISKKSNCLKMYILVVRYVLMCWDIHVAMISHVYCVCSLSVYEWVSVHIAYSHLARGRYYILKQCLGWTTSNQIKITLAFLKKKKPTKKKPVYVHDVIVCIIHQTVLRCFLFVWETSCK